MITSLRGSALLVAAILMPSGTAHGGTATQGSPSIPSGPDAAHAAPPQARVNLATLVTVHDYPPSAVRAEEQGTTAFDLEVGPDGRVRNCVVTASSGSAALDATTCRLMIMRARFTPARDGGGNPVAGSISSRISWQLSQ